MQPVNDLPDIEIGRYALRTFDIDKGKLGSLYKHHHWDGGVAIATCLTSNRCDSPPGEGCSCGLYGTLSLQQLESDYGPRVRTCVAVFAAEGPTIIGSKGLRTSAARVVAYWCAEGLRDCAAVFARECPNATRFTEMDEMLKAYQFEPMAEFGAAARREQEQREHQERFLRSISGPTYPTYPRRSSWDNIASLVTAASPGGLAALKSLVGVVST
jgi:hypothetical protein